MQDINSNRRTIRDSLATFTAVLILITGCSDDDTGATTDKNAGGDAASGVASDGGDAGSEVANNDGDAGVKVSDDSGMMDVGTQNDGASADSSTPAPRIDLSDGPIQGAVAGSTLRYMNIPFAASPTGELRWRPPEPVEPWEEVRDASEPGVACIQASVPGGKTIQIVGIETSEDCLYLNVWTPDLTPAEPLPVMLWLHGGGNSTGGAVENSSEGGTMSWNGQRFIEAASQPVVVVTANYRLGIFGFLAHRGLTQEQGTSGNYGLMDQQAALRWVRDNISAFGGDHENVTLFGESAGAEDTCLHLVAPDSAGLFHRAILESAPQAISGLMRGDLDQGEAQGAAFADFVGCGGADDADVVACLRGLTLEELQKTVETEMLPGGILFQEVPLNIFQPIIDGVLLPKLVADSIAANQQAKIPVIVGTNEAEGILFHHSLVGSIPVADEDEYKGVLERVFGDTADAVAAEYPVSDYESAEDALIEVTGDFWFVCPARNLSRALTGQGGTVFKYNFTHTIEFVAYNALGPTHGMELIPLWTQSNYLTDSEKALGATMVDYWTRFAYTGDPNGDDAPSWPRFETETEPEIVLDVQISTVEGRKSDKCDFWASIE